MAGSSPPRHLLIQESKVPELQAMNDEEMLPPRSDDEFAVPSTSTSFQPYISNQSFDTVLQVLLRPSPAILPFQEMLLASPSHLFSAGLLPQDRLAANWETWLCLLASSLTPDQWQVSPPLLLRISSPSGVLAGPYVGLRSRGRAHPHAVLL